MRTPTRTHGNECVKGGHAFLKNDDVKVVLRPPASTSMCAPSHGAFTHTGTTGTEQRKKEWFGPMNRIDKHTLKVRKTFNRKVSASTTQSQST